MENQITWIRNDLESLVEKHKNEMSVNVYEYLWQIIQSIDITLKNKEK